MSGLNKNEFNKKFKKRYFFKKTNFLKLKFGKLGIFFLKEFRFEFVYFVLLKKFLKKLSVTKNKFSKYSKF